MRFGCHEKNRQTKIIFAVFPKWVRDKNCYVWLEKVRKVKKYYDTSEYVNVYYQTVEAEVYYD
jgi:hypothetical protein